MTATQRIKLTGAVFLFPALAFVLFYNVVPFVWNLGLSFVAWDGFNDATFVGIANYVTTANTTLMVSAIKNSLWYAFASTAGSTIIGLVFATCIFRLHGKDASFFRLVLYSPSMLPAAVVGIIFVFFFNGQMGLLNSFLDLIGLENLAHIWLQDSGTAMNSIIFVAIWRSTGFIMLLTFASMQGVPSSLYESARLDGANFVQQMWFITYPLIKPMILLATINTLGKQFKSYDLIYTMTQGGPADLTTTVPIVMKKMAFTYGNFGVAAAMGVLFTIIVALSIILVNLTLKGETYEY